MTYTLPELSYDYASLEPHISARIMELHHSKHHQAYVTGANAALEAMAKAREEDNFASLPKLQKDLAFNLGGHINHSIFWQNLSPNGGEAAGDLLAASLTALVHTKHSPSTSLPQQWAFRVRVGHTWHGIQLAIN